MYCTNVSIFVVDSLGKFKVITFLQYTFYLYIYKSLPVCQFITRESLIRLSFLKLISGSLSYVCMGIWSGFSQCLIKINSVASKLSQYLYSYVIIELKLSTFFTHFLHVFSDKVGI